MTKKQNLKDDYNKTPGHNQPYMLGYAVRNSKDGKSSYWSKIAAAWAHKDGEGFEVQMDALPIDGRLVLRTVSDDRQPGSEQVCQKPSGPS